MGTESEPVPLAERIRGPLNSTKSTKDHEPPEEELEKIRKWQEERIERKLRGEYESALLHLDGLVSISPKLIYHPSVIEWLSDQRKP